jgi:hypothetical protein
MRALQKAPLHPIALLRLKMMIHVAVAIAVAVAVDVVVVSQTLMESIPKKDQRMVKRPALMQAKKVQKVERIAVAVAAVQLVKALHLVKLLMKMA